MKEKKRGFTLIELLVVISIISVLSSIVLASLNSAREKGINSAIVQEAVQLRNAIELYRSEFGEVPFECEGYNPGSGNCESGGGGIFKTGQENWIDEYWGDAYNDPRPLSVLEPYLVDNNYIASIPESHQVCADNSCNYEIGYITSPYNDVDYACGGSGGCGDDYSAYCGGIPWDDYVIYIYWDGGELKLPEFKLNWQGGSERQYSYETSTEMPDGNAYCLPPL